MIRINETINLCNPIYCYNVIDKKAAYDKVDIITFPFIGRIIVVFVLFS